MGINCKDFRTSWKVPSTLRKTGKEAGNGGVPVITYGKNWAVMNVGKSIVHNEGLLHESVHLVIISGDGKKILLQQRGKAKKQWKEYWDIIGEHVITGDRHPLDVAKNVFIVELGRNWRSPSYKFDSTDELNYIVEGKKQVTKHDFEIRHVYVIIADDINYSVVESMNKELEKIKDDRKETVKFKWFNKEEFDSYVSDKKIVPYAYWENYELYDNFKTFFREKAKKYCSENDKDRV